MTHPTVEVNCMGSVLSNYRSDFERHVYQSVFLRFCGDAAYV